MSDGVNTTEIMPQMARVAIDMLAAIDHKPFKQRAKEFAKTLLGRGRASDRDPLFWPAGFLLLGLTESDIPEARETAVQYYRRWCDKKIPVRYADDALAGYAALRLYEETGDASARETAVTVYQFLKDAPRDAAGSIIYHPSAANRCVFADGAGMTALFLAAYGRHDGRTAAYERLPGADQPVGDTGLTVSGFAALQLDNYRKYGMDERTGLPYHGYLLREANGGASENAAGEATTDVFLSEKKGIIGWGRAVGFLLMGASAVAAMQRDDDAAEPEKHSDHIAGAADIARTLSAAAHAAIRPDGLFSWQLTAPEGHVDTSATAMIGWALAQMETEIADRTASTVTQKATLTERSGIDRMAEALRDYVTSEGRMTESLAECVDFGEHPQRYGVYPWGQGAAMAFLSAADFCSE